MFRWGGARQGLAVLRGDIGIDVQVFVLERDGMHLAAFMSNLPIRCTDLGKAVIASEGHQLRCFLVVASKLQELLNFFI